MTAVTHGDLTLTYGWDAPLQYFYLTVERGEQLLYSNLDDPEAQSGSFGGGLTLHQLQARLAEQGVTLTPNDLDALSGAVRASSPRSPVLTRLLRDLNHPDES